jgi:hypothetical protein
MSFVYYQISMEAGNPVAVAHCALSAHFGVGAGEDVELAAGYYDSVMECDPPFVTRNTDRCFRGLNKRQVRKPLGDIQQTQTLYQQAGMRDKAEFDGLLVSQSILLSRAEPLYSDGGALLGSGSFGLVRLAIDPHVPERAIAVKRVGSNRQAFFEEVANMNKLRHPCVVALYGWSTSDSGTCEIQMQLARRGALSRHLTARNSPIPRSFGNPTQKGILLCDIVLGMRHVHSHRIIHRDLKPANIFIDGNGRGLIGDFGLSHSISAKGLPTEAVGTPLYAAPEQTEDGVAYTEKVDVFAFALISYEIIGDWPIFPGGRPDRFPEIPDTFGSLMQRLIPRCWSCKPRHRPSFEAIFAEFQKCEFAILPGVDAKSILQAVSEVLEKEQRSPIEN